MSDRQEHIAEIKKLLGDTKLVIGIDRTLKGLRNNTISKVFLASNCPKDTKADISHHSALGNVEVIDLEMTNEELGDICKKPFFIMVIGILKE